MRKVGFNLVECLVALCVLTIISSTLLMQFRCEQELFICQTKESIKNTSEILGQEFFIRDYESNPNDTFFYEKFEEVLHSDIKLSKNSESAIVENWPTILSIPRKMSKKILSPPEVNEKFIVSEFPVSKFIKYPIENPPDTLYRYTDGAFEPTEKSAKWLGWSYEEETLPRKISISAFHSECYFLPSKSATIEFIIPDVEIKFSREIEHSTSTQFSLDEIISHTNKIDLKTDKISSFFNIHYTINGEDPTSLSPKFKAPFHVFSQYCNDDTIILRTKAVPVNNKFKDITFSNTFTLLKQRVKLNTPKIHMPDNEVLYKGDTIIIDKKEPTDIGILNVEYKSDSNGIVNLHVKEENS